MPNDTTLITGGTNAVVCVWKLPGAKDKGKTLQLKQVSLLLSEFFFMLIIS